MPKVRVGELEIFYDVEGEGEPVVTLMGLGGEHRAWDLQRAELARRHRVILIDNRDAGASDEAQGGYGTGDMAADALGILDQLGVERFHVVGASMGGAIAQHLALQAPTRVATLVLASTWARTDPFLAAVFTGWRLLVERLDPEAFLAVQAPWAFTHRFLASPPPEVVAAQARLRDRGVPKSIAAYQRQVDACLAHDTIGLLPLLQTPTLVLVGEDDILTPARYARTIAAALGRAELVVLPATGHACFLESAKPFTDRVLRFLARHPMRA
jgi:3-oxoadipate enol-lactonase